VADFFTQGLCTNVLWMRSTVNPFHQPLFEPVDRETIECDLDLLVRAQMNHFGYVGCSQVGDWSAIAGPGVLCRFREAALRERGNGRPRVLRPEGRKLCGPRPGQGTAGTGE